MQNMYIFLIEIFTSKENLPRESILHCVSEGQRCSQPRQKTGHLESWVRKSAKITGGLGVSGHSLNLSELLFSSCIKLECGLHGL